LQCRLMHPCPLIGDHPSPRYEAKQSISCAVLGTSTTIDRTPIRQHVLIHMSIPRVQEDNGLVLGWTAGFSSSPNTVRERMISALDIAGGFPMQARWERTTRSPRCSRLYHPPERTKGRTTLTRSSTFCTVRLPFLNSLRNELTAPSGEILSMLAAIQDVDFPCRWQYFARNCIL
jgi:hypothetical protein